MKLFAWILVSVAMLVIVFGAILFIGHFTIGYEQIKSYIGVFAISMWCGQFASWIIDKITDKDERV